MGKKTGIGPSPLSSAYEGKKSISSLNFGETALEIGASAGEDIFWWSKEIRRIMFESSEKSGNSSDVQSLKKISNFHALNRATLTFPILVRILVLLPVSFGLDVCFLFLTGRA